MSIHYVKVCMPYVVSIDFWQYKVEVEGRCIGN